MLAPSVPTWSPVGLSQSTIPSSFLRSPWEEVASRLLQVLLCLQLRKELVLENPYCISLQGLHSLSCFSGTTTLWLLMGAIVTIMLCQDSTATRCPHDHESHLSKEIWKYSIQKLFSVHLLIYSLIHTMLLRKLAVRFIFSSWGVWELDKWFGSGKIL